MMTRNEHVAWCKKRALEYVERGDMSGAYTSMCTDLNNHDETAGHPAIELGMMLLVTGHLDSKHEMRKFINDFN